MDRLFCDLLSEKGVPVAQIGWFSAVSGVFLAPSGRDLSGWVGALPIRADVLIDWASWRFFLTRFGRVSCLYDFNDIHVLVMALLPIRLPDMVREAPNSGLGW